MRASGNDAFAPGTDAGAAAWVLADLLEFGSGVGSIIPARFERYARVFHPATRGAQTTVSWSAVAAANERQMHRAAEWGSITGSLDYIYNGGQPGIWDHPPELGGPPAQVAERLLDVLAKFTETPNDCWFAVSEIWGSPLLENIRAAPKFGTDDRRYFLLHAPLQSARTSPHCTGDRLADLWWPDDRAWFVGSDVDLLSTYVGGTDACIRRLVGDEALESFRVPVDQSVSWDSDTINPIPPPPLPH